MPDPIGPLTLLAALGTAEDVRRGIAARRAGRDPAALTPEPEARQALAEVREDLGDVLTRLLVHLTIAQRDAQDDARADVAHLRRFDMLMTLRRTERLFHLAHQHLLSRYAALHDAGDAGGETLESARHLTREAGDLASRLAEPAELRGFAERALGFARALPER